MLCSPIKCIDTQFRQVKTNQLPNRTNYNKLLGEKRPQIVDQKKTPSGRRVKKKHLYPERVNHLKAAKNAVFDFSLKTLFVESFIPLSYCLFLLSQMRSGLDRPNNSNTRRILGPCCHRSRRRRSVAG